LFSRLKIAYRKRSTGALYALCPFHREKTASLRVWPDSCKFLCFGCHTDGSITDFIAEYYNQSGDSTKIEEWALEIVPEYISHEIDQFLFPFMIHIPGIHQSKLAA